MRQIIAFGDSNTWGLNPVLKNRYPEDVRWTGLLRKKLSRKGVALIEEGLCGRTTVFDDPDRTGLKGIKDIAGILSRHTYSAITMRRSYKAPRTHEEAIGIIREVAGTQLDKDLVDIFVKIPKEELVRCIPEEVKY